jgi:YbbR domain-containing protein
VQPGEVVAVVDLRGARAGQRLFHVLTDAVRVPFGIDVSQINPPTVPLTFERSATRMVPVVPAVDGEPAVGFIAGQVLADPQTVEVVGPESRLKELREATTEPVSLKNATASIQDTVTVGVVDPALRLRVPQSATVTVDILPAPIERAIYDIPVRVRNLSRGLEVTVNPSRVTVILRGARTALGSLDQSGLEAWVDAASLSAGRYALPVRFDPGREYGISRVEPAEVQVRLQ